ncbi:hypothetical protein KY285_001074 [Solanum tuberosum]|nr:hypothetical protein KY285_001074 [Solanum tuberosum]
MDSGTTHHLTSDLDNLGIHSEYIKDLATRVPLHKGWTNRGLYTLPVTKLPSPASFATSVGVWYARLAHASYPTVRQALPSIVFQSSKSPSVCTTCAISKSHKDALVSTKPTNTPLDHLTLHIPLSPTIPPSPNNFLSNPSPESFMKSLSTRSVPPLSSNRAAYFPDVLPAPSFNFAKNTYGTTTCGATFTTCSTYGHLSSNWFPKT